MGDRQQLHLISLAYHSIVSRFAVTAPTVSEDQDVAASGS